MPLKPHFSSASFSGNGTLWETDRTAGLSFEKPDKSDDLPAFGPSVYTHYFEWLKQDDPALAVCRLNEDCRLELSRKFLKVRKRGRNQVFSLRKIKEAKSVFRYLMFPMIIGGIIGPLAALAVHKEQTDFWLGTAIFLAGGFLFIQGIRGSWQLSLRFDAVTINLTADKPDEAIKTFTDRLNKLLKKNRPGFEG